MSAPQSGGSEEAVVGAADCRSQKELLGRRFRALVEHSAEAISVVAPDATMLYMSPGSRRILDFAPEELVGRNAFELVHPEDRAAVAEALAETLRRPGEPVEAHFRAIHRDGTPRWIEVTGTNLLQEPAVGGIVANLRDMTERHRSEARYKALVEHTSEAVTLLAMDGSLKYCTPGIKGVLGYAPEEVSGRNAFEWVHPEDQARVAEALGQALIQPRVPVLSEFRALHRDGSVRWVEATGTNLLDEPGVEGVVVNFRDITARREATEALRTSEERYRTIVETANEGVWEIDAANRTTFVNARMAEILGYPPQEILGKSPLDFMPAEDRVRAAEDLRKRQSGMRGQIDGRFLGKEGREVRVLLESSPRLEKGKPAGALAMVMDVTARRKTEAALKASETRFARLAESSIVGIALADVSGGLHEANDEYLRILGFTREDLRAGRLRWSELTPPEWQHTDLQAVQQLQATGVARAWEKELFRKDGTRVPVLIGVSMLDHPNCAAMMVDLTELKKAQAALSSTEQQLRQAQKMEAVGNLAGGVAHDFNNLLSIVLSYSTMIMEDLKPGDPLRADVEEIHKAGQRGAALTRQLLAFGRRQVPQKKVLDLNEVVAGVEKMLRRLIGEDVGLTIVPGSDLGRVNADPGQLEQVLLNLVVNARDAMPSGGKLTIETGNVVLDEGFTRKHLGTRPGPHVLLAVTDTGCGMDPATMARIFEPFFTTKEKGKGTGLGLATVFGIVQQSEGTIWVYSEPGKGTTFKVYLPRVDAEASPVQPDLPRPAALNGKESILLVEDEESVRNVARSVLRRAGYRVVEARNAGEALLVGEKERGTLDLVLSDVVMPSMSGGELAERLKVTRPNLKVLFMSGYADDAIVRHGVLTAGVPFLQKPLLPEPLLRKVREVLDSP